MDKEQKMIDNIRKAAGTYSRKAPEGLLDDIKKEMARRGVAVSSGPVPVPGANRKLSVVWGRRTAVAAAAAAIAAVLVVTNLPKGGDGVIADRKVPAGEQSSSTSRNNPVLSGNSEQGGAVTSGNGILAFARNVVSSLADDGRTLVASITSAARGTDGVLTAYNNVSADAPAVASQSPLSDSQMSGEQPQRQSLMKKNAMPKNWYGSGDHDYGGASSYKGNSGLALAVNYSGMGSMSSESGFGGIMLNANTASDPAFADKADFIGLAKAESGTTTHAHHDMPIKLGVSLRYNINGRWSLQTGVNYSYLSSDITRENSYEESSSKQKLHYVSVPVTASYSVWHNKNVNVYVSAGAEAAKLVKGKANVTSKVYDGSNSVNTSSENISEHRLQYSVNGAAGIEYKPTGSISVYAEPGVTRYFNNHSSVVNIYKDKPTQFTINVGLRINLNKK